MNVLYYETDELYHYGVLGMKWGVHKARRKNDANERLQNKAFKYDQKSAVYTKKSERIHAEKDLELSNRQAKKAAKYSKKAAGLHKKAVGLDDGLERTLVERKAEKLNYKAARAKRKANLISKTEGYGNKAMKYSIKSDKMAEKAAKARVKIANNKAYIERMNRKIASLSEEDLISGYTFIQELKNN